jgi:hypothetical protein
MMKKRIATSLVVLLILTNFSFGQEGRKLGLSASLQGNQYSIIVPIWLGEKFVLAPQFSLSAAEKIGTDFSISLAPRFYLKNDKLSPYFGLKIGTAIYAPSSKNPVDTKSKFDFIGGLAFGAEYFITDIFSIGLEAQGNFTKSASTSLRFGNPGGINFNTSTAIIATIYF